VAYIIGRRFHIVERRTADDGADDRERGELRVNASTRKEDEDLTYDAR
jgi:hypothetical protein